MSLAEHSSFILTAPIAASNLAAADKAASAIAFDLVSGETFDNAISQFDDVCSEQTYAFARGRWPEFIHEPLLFRERGEVVGAAMMLIRRMPLGLGSLAIGKWTPMLRNRSAAEAPRRYRAIVEALVAEYARKRRMVLSLLPHVSAEGDTSDEAFLRQRGFIESGNIPFPTRYIVDLRPDDETHRKALHSKWRYHLNHSEKAGLDFVIGDAASFAEFDALYRAMSDRKRFPDYSAFATIPDLLMVDDVALRPRLFFVRKEGRMVAGAVIFTAGDTAVYLYGATNEEALPLRAGYFMHWQIVRWLKANSRARWYDLGGCDGFSGLHQFKKSFVGKAGVLVPMPTLHHYAESRLKLRLGIGLFRLREAVKRLRYLRAGSKDSLARPDLTSEPAQ